MNRSTVALREYADFEVYGEDGDCLYTTANVWPAAQSTGWGILSAARAADGIVLRAGNGGLAGACPVTARGGAVLGYAVFRMDDANFDAFFAPLLRGADDLLLVDATWRLLYASQPLRADDTLALLRWLDESQQADKLFENQQLLRQPIVRNGRAATVGYRPEVWEKWE